jgi:starvation-inducible outer membrane lipoprotein
MSELGRLVLAFLGIMVMILAGCAAGPSRLEADFGSSVSLATMGQILDPAAQQNLAPVYGFDGKAAAATIERYQTAFEKPTPPPSFVISVGQGR